MDCAIVYSLASFVTVTANGETPYVFPHYHQAPMHVCEKRRTDPTLKRSGWKKGGRLRPIRLDVFLCLPCRERKSLRTSLARKMRERAKLLEARYRDKFDAHSIDATYPLPHLPRWPHMDRYSDATIRHVVSEHFLAKLTKIPVAPLEKSAKQP
jgi:hypothetical protein